MIAFRKPVTRTIAAGAAVIVVLFAGGCGSSDDAGADQGGKAAAAGKDTTDKNGNAGSSDEGGTITLTVDGKTTKIPSGQCVIIETSRIQLSIDTHGLHALLPAKPGAFTKRDRSTVILPPPPGDEFRNTRDVHGKWESTGNRANGHVEGVAHLLSGLTSSDDPAIPFSFDFECPLTDITLNN